MDRFELEARMKRGEPKMHVADNDVSWETVLELCTRYRYDCNRGTLMSDCGNNPAHIMVRHTISRPGAKRGR
jgi:hypothetical protein